MLVLISLCRYAFRWPAAEQAIYVALRDYFPGETGVFLTRNLQAHVRPIQWVSMALLLFTANGVFEPLEVALNRAWGVTANRSFVKNQIVSLGLIFACGTLAVLSTIFTAFNQDWAMRFLPGLGGASLAAIFFFKLAAVPTSILILFLVYWLLPNGPVPKALAFQTAVYVALVLEAVKYVNLFLLPLARDKMEHEYGVFVNSATLIFLSFFAAMIVMAGAEYTARRQTRDTLKT
jgi:uncharacterized BrkB/YihY/UPF0761 family membrane protein